MAYGQVYNEQTGQYEDDPNDPQNKAQDSNPPAPAQPAPFNGTQPAQTPTGSWNREEFKNRWQSQGTGQNVSAWLGQNQDVGQGVRLVPGSQDKVILPSGEVMDLSINSTNGTGTAGWTGAGGYDPQRGFYAYAPDGGAAPGAPAAPGAGTGTSTVQMTAEQTAKKQQDDALRQEMLTRLRGRADQGLNVDAANNQNIRQQVDPYAAAQERARRNYLDALAEKSGPNANLGAETRLTAEHAAQNVGQYEGGLVGQEIEAKRKEIADALTSMQGMLTTEEENMLREKLAMLSDATQRYGIQTQASTAAAGQNIDWQSELLRNQQSQDQLGFNVADRSNYWDAINRGIIKG